MRVLDALRAAGQRGLSIRDLIIGANVTDPKDCVYELRWHGYSIVSEWHRSERGKRFVHYVLADGEGVWDGTVSEGIQRQSESSSCATS